MKKESTGGAQAPRKSYDYTSTQRQQKRRDKLNAIAQRHGFPGWSAFETALINEQISVTVKRDAP